MQTVAAPSGLLGLMALVVKSEDLMSKEILTVYSF